MQIITLQGVEDIGKKIVQQTKESGKEIVSGAKQFAEKPTTKNLSKEQDLFICFALGIITGVILTKII